MSPRTYWIYILASRRNGTLYVGVTNSLEKRLWRHRTSSAAGAASFSARYQVHRLVYWERFTSIDHAIAREKQLKAGSRAKKIALIETENPEWLDLAAGWGIGPSH